MRKRYTRIVAWPRCYSVRLTVGVQSFTVNDHFESRREAAWHRDMLAVALDKIT